MKLHCNLFKSIGPSLVLGLSYGINMPLLRAQPPVVIENKPEKSPFPDLIFAQHPVLNSIARGDAGALKNLLEKNAKEINEPHESGYTPLSAAARTGNTELVQVLLDKGAQIKPYISSDGNSRSFGNPLMMAATAGSVEVMQLLIDKGVSLDDPQNGSLMNYAVQNGNTKMVEFLLKKGMDIEGNRNSGYSPLIAAIQNGNTKMMEFLLEKGASPDPPATSSYYSPLYAAVQRGNEETIKLLIDKGADPFATTRNTGQSALAYAIIQGKREMLAALLPEKVDINQKDQRGQTLLHTAASSANVTASLVDFLVEKGAQINARDAEGRTPLHIAAQSGTISPLNALVQKKADLAAKTKMGETPLHLALDKPEAATALLEAGADPSARNARGDLPLHLILRTSLDDKTNAKQSEKVRQAAREANLKLRLALIEKSDINAKDQFGFTPLQIALLTRQNEMRDAIMVREPRVDSITSLFDAAARNDVEQLKTLLAEKPYLNFMRLSNGATPLHVAAQWGARDAVDYLIVKQSDINARDADAMTPLLRVLSPDTGPKDDDVKAIATFLLDKGAEPGVLDEDDEGALHAAVRRGSKDLAALLIAKNADVNARNTSGQSPLDLLLPGGSGSSRSRSSRRTTVTELGLDKTLAREIATLLIEKGADIERGDSSGQTPLMRVAAVRDIEMMNLLLKKGANVNAQNTQGETALMRLAMYGYSSTYAKQILEATELLVEKGADVNTANRYGETVLMRALNNSNEVSARYLIEKGADLNATRPGTDPAIFRIISLDKDDLLKLAIEKKVDVNVKDNSNHTPLMRAVIRGDAEMVEMLLEAGADPKAKNAAGQTALDLEKRGNDDIRALLKDKK